MPSLVRPEELEREIPPEVNFEKARLDAEVRRPRPCPVPSSASCDEDCLGDEDSEIGAGRIDSIGMMTAEVRYSDDPRLGRVPRGSSERPCSSHPDGPAACDLGRTASVVSSIVARVAFVAGRSSS